MRRYLLPALALMAAPAAAQDKPATPAQIADAIDACAAITSPTWLELKQLPSHGWKPFEKRGGRRGAMKVRGAYEKVGNEALIIISKEELKQKACVVFAKLDNTADYGPTAQGVSEFVGMPVRAEGPTYFWIMDDKEMRLDPAGDRDKPIARFEITAIPQESAE
ncbi:hypothetical protein [Qipengyuania flava]|uniref:hypothetical protein n=1 Tax=Qipengyuania flava TaxID=192812 RepID=UPI001C634EB2|nr:hypothetical protein [Qipengyuania flava]QYJ06421.1 hypothetical protein KUV82_10090 [Qipengyuania flava]